MTSKILTLLAAIGAAISSFINWLATVPPETQSGMLANMVDVLPLDWRPTIGLWSRAAMFFLGIYASYKASHSGPQTPPRNSPNE